MPLPPSLFPVFEEVPRLVHRDGYVVFQRTYHSVPAEYVGRNVWVRWDFHLVRVFNRRREQTALHVRTEPGNLSPTRNNFIHAIDISFNTTWITCWNRARLIRKHPEVGQKP